VELSWYLYRYLAVWAQSQIVGYLWALRNPDTIQEIADELGIEELSGDSHLLEYIGLAHVYNQVNEDDPFLKAVFDALEQSNNWDLDNDTLRLVIRELLMSRSTESSFWRFPLQHDLYALNFGQATGLCLPSARRRQGQPYDIDRWRVLAICHVYLLIGQGMKKCAALEKVASSLGQSVETLRDWEKALKKYEDYEINFQEARVAGRHKDSIQDTATWRRWFKEEYLDERYRNTPLRDRARYTLDHLTRVTLADVKKGLREAREKSKNVVARKRPRTPKKTGSKRH
jgi:hypothetical protein